MAKKKKKNKSKVRAEFRKRYESRNRENDLTRRFQDSADQLDEIVQSERVSGKGKLTRKRTIRGTSADNEDSGFQVELSVDSSNSLPGRVMRVHGLNSIVRTEKGEFVCSIRGILKSLSTDLQNVVVAGDYVTIQVSNNDEPSAEHSDKESDQPESQAANRPDSQAVIVRIEPRTNAISRTSRDRQQIIAANVQQGLIVASAAQPGLKPNLIDRMLMSIERSNIQPVIVINKIDLVSPADLQPCVSVWGQLGYPVVLVSAETGQGMNLLKKIVAGKDSVVTGQSGVGKSSILNAIQSGLSLRVAHVSSENDKGRHTTTAAELIPLDTGGHIVDTPGIRQFQLWDVIPAEVAGMFRDIRPFINRCKFPDCTHTHEEICGIKDAVADGLLDVRRYDSYCQIRES